MNEPQSLFDDHAPAVLAWTRDALARCEGRFEAVVLHAGSPRMYHADDQAVALRTVPHFARLAPGVAGPHHLLLVPREGRPRLIRVCPRDFWEEAPPRPPLVLEGAFDVVEVADAEGAKKALAEAWSRPAELAYVGNDPALADALGLPPDAVEPAALLAALDWHRGTKTPFEVACLREAARRAAGGHAAARAAAARGASELAIHYAYLEGTAHLERELPYETIVAWDEASATLHYATKRAGAPRPGDVFLIDAGAAHLGYASDITRTYARAGTHPLFRRALERMTALQDALVRAVRPGLSYVALHEQAYRGAAEVLLELGVLRGTVDDACARELPRPFFPHGLGHHLGLQVHDVGGKLQDPSGTEEPSPAAYPWLRTTRRLEVGHAVTIEPGLYFIPVLLEPLRVGPHADAVDWSLVEQLSPCGGIRVEDDVVVTAEGCDNLSRPFVPTDWAL